MLNKKLSRIKELLITEAFLAETMLIKSLKGFMERKTYLLHEVIEEDEPIMNSMDMEMDRLCTQTTALYHPGPKDLRFVLSALKVNYDLERIGDHAVNIAESALEVIPYDLSELKPVINRISKQTIDMLRDAIKSFVDEDNELAHSVLKRDDIIDQLRDECMKLFSEKIKQNPEMSSVYLELVRIVRSLERVADLSTNIAEDAIFVKKAQLAKHGKEEEI